MTDPWCQSRTLDDVCQMLDVPPTTSFQSFPSKYLGHTPIPRRTDVYFPLTRDHALLHVIALNVSRAILTNWEIVSTVNFRFTTSYASCTGGISIVAPPLPSLDLTYVTLPKALEPTPLQLIMPHPNWVDLFPLPQLRENLIVAISESRIDPDEFVEDLVGDMFDYLGCGESLEPVGSTVQSIDPKLLQETSASPAGSNTGSSKSARDELGIVAWSDPWDITAWEVTAAFAEKWHFLLKGCSEVISASNKWRVARGEDPLVLEI
jgi:hypothetical protein